MKSYKKRVFRVFTVILILFFIPYLICKGEFGISSSGKESENEYLKFYDFDPSGELGTKENPFIILEIVPYRGMGQIGYLIGGEEPVDPNVSTYGNNLYGVFDGFANGAFKVSQVKKDTLSSKDIQNGGWQWTNYELKNQEGYFEKVEDSTGLYEKKVVNTGTIFKKSSNGTGDYNWIEKKNVDNIVTDYEADRVWMVHYTLDVSCWENIGNWLFENTEIFKKDVLHISEKNLVNYHVRVVTITPDELNKNVAKFSKYYDLSKNGVNNKSLTKANPDGEIDLIGNADLISISPSAQAGNNSVINLWESYGRDKSGISSASSRFEIGFGKNDLNWQTTMELFMKVGVVEDSAPVVYDITCYDTPAGKSLDQVSSLIGNEKAKGYLNNIYKLCLLLRQRDPVEVYNLYFNTNHGEENPLVTTTTIDGITTGMYQAQKNTNSMIYWNYYTFLPPFPDGTYPDYISVTNPDYRKYLVDLNIILGWEDKHDAVIRNTYSYNGTSNMVQRFIIKDYGLTEEAATNTKIEYNKDFFEYLEEKEGIRQSNASPCEAVEYILNREKKRENEKDSIKVLDLEPCNDFNLTISQLRQWIPSYTGYIEIVQQTTAEFIGKVEDLNHTYDLIYIGTNTGKMNVDFTGKTVYNDPLMDGLVYSHVGDRILGYDNFLGILKENNNIVKTMNYINFGENAYSIANIFKGYSAYEFSYIKEVADFYRFSGNDITKRKEDELKEYIAGGYPVLLKEELYSCNKEILDDSSNLYDFLNLNKNCEEFINLKKITKLTNEYISEKDRLTRLVNKEKLKLLMNTLPKEFKIDDKNSLIKDRILTYEFSIQSSTESDADNIYDWCIYVDNNADGRFVDKEIILSGSVEVNQVVYKSKKLSEKYVGVIPWKLEVIQRKNKNIRTEQTGYAAFKTPETTEEESEKTRINILQITSNKSTLNLQELMNPPSGKTSLFYQYTNQLDDFNVKITTINVAQFLNLYKGSGNSYDINNPEMTDKLYFVEDGVKKAYDMLIFGFGDSYSDINNDNGALNNVQAFIDSGKSIMFTHDTTSFVNIKVNGEYYDNTNRGKTLSNWGYGFNQYLRNRVGLDRFGVMKESGDTTTYDKATMPSKVAKSLYKSGILTNNQTTYPEIQGYTYGNLVAFGNPSNNPWGNIYNANKNYPPFSTGNAIVLGTGIDHYFTKYVTKVNEGQITNYPYVIPDGFKITTTHTQYYQVNMEDPEIVVWFCLSDVESNLFTTNRSASEINTHSKETGPYSTSPNDGRNNYYIYSKGNIMYTGVGHSSMDKLVDKNKVDETNANEVKLFINTMIASYNAGVTSPSVVITNEEAVKKSSSESILYEDSESYGNISGATRRIKFIADDKNLSSDKVIARVYSFDDDGNRIRINPVIKDKTGTQASLYQVAGKEVGYQVENGEEYYFDLPLDRFFIKGTDKVMIIVTNEKNLTGDVSAIIQNRILFDLD